MEARIRGKQNVYARAGRVVRVSLQSGATATVPGKAALRTYLRIQSKILSGRFRRICAVRVEKKKGRNSVLKQRDYTSLIFLR